MVRVWDPTGRPPGAHSGAPPPAVSAVFGPAGPLLATASNDGGVYLWNAATGGYEREMNVETERVWAEAFSPGGELLATANDDDSVRLWYRTTGRLVAAITEHRGRVRSLAFSTDGRLLATGCDDRGSGSGTRTRAALRRCCTGTPTGCTRLPSARPATCWPARATTGRPTCGTPTTGGAPVTRPAASCGRPRSAPGGVLATAGDDGTVRLWAPPATSCTRWPGTPNGSARSRSARGDLLASAADDGTVRLWPVARGQAARHLTLLGLPDGWAAFPPTAGTSPTAPSAASSGTSSACAGSSPATRRLPARDRPLPLDAPF